MKEAATQLKVEFKQMDLDEIEVLDLNRLFSGESLSRYVAVCCGGQDLHDDMSDLMEQNEEIQEIMGRSYG